MKKDLLDPSQSPGSSGYEEPKTLNQVIGVIQNDLIDTIIINPLRVE